MSYSSRFSIATRLPRPCELSVGICLIVISSFTSAAELVSLTDVTAATELQIPNAAACWADFDNDGWVDLEVSWPDKTKQTVSDIGTNRTITVELK